MKSVYLMKGQGASSILSEPAFQNVFKAIFAGYTVELDLTGNKAHFLAKFFSSNLAYLSLHNATSRMELKVANGDMVSVADMGAAFKARNLPLPGLVIVTGCQTVGNAAGDLAGALGISNGSAKRALIGFARNVVGNASDRFFRFFLAHWVHARKDGTCRTLAEARKDAQDFMKRMMSPIPDTKADAFGVPEAFGGVAGVRAYPFSMKLGARVSGAPWTNNDADIGNQFKTVGNDHLKVHDL